MYNITNIFVKILFATCFYTHYSTKLTIFTFYNRVVFYYVTPLFMKFYGCNFYGHKNFLIKETSIVLWHNDGIDNLRREFVKRQIFLLLCTHF